jgi:hypothetical protein
MVSMHASIAAVAGAARVNVETHRADGDWFWGSDYDGPHFIDATVPAGLTEFAAASSWGANFVDIDGDGDLDLYVSQVGATNRLLLNDGTGNFTDITVSAGLLDPSNSRGASFADVNGDGHLDLYQLNTDLPNRLYLNDGKNHFERQWETGLEDDGSGQTACFADIDGDGDNDLFFTNFDKTNKLYINNGRGEFTDATEESGLTSAADSGGFQCEFGDIDNDGDLDLHIANSVDRNYLYINDGTGHFIERAQQRGCPGEEGISAGSRMGDFNGDGYLDIWAAALAPNHLYVNDGTGHFTEGTEAAGLDAVGTLTLGFNIADVDGDGDLDLLQGRGAFAMSLYQNDGNGVFTDISSESGIGVHIFSHGIAAGDVDGDGDQDFHLNSWDAVFGLRQTNRLMVNEGVPAYNWLKVRPVNANGHATLMGAQARVFEAGTQTKVGVHRHTDGGHCFGSQDAYDIFFGLSQSSASHFDVEVQCGGAWITKADQPSLGNVAPNQVVTAPCTKSHLGFQGS